MLYGVIASISVTTKGNGDIKEWESTLGLPTFFLDPTVQGILTIGQAEKVARKVVDPFGEYGDRLNLFVSEVY